MTGQKTENGAKAGVKSALRTLSVFEIFASRRQPISQSELARALDIPVSSCHGLIQTLQAEGYLQVMADRRLYPTRRLKDLTDQIHRHDPAPEMLRPHLEALRDKTGETVILGRRQGDAIVYLDVIEGTHTIRYQASAGEVKPLHSSSMGKAILGTMDEDELFTLLARLDLKAVTGNTLTRRSALLADIETGRENGYFVTRGENVADVWAIAMTIDLKDDMLGIVVAGPAHRMEPGLTELTAMLKSCIAEFTQG